MLPPLICTAISMIKTSFLGHENIPQENEHRTLNNRGRTNFSSSTKSRYRTKSVEYNKSTFGLQMKVQWNCKVGLFYIFCILIYWHTILKIAFLRPQTGSTIIFQETRVPLYGWKISTLVKLGLKVGYF